MKEQLRTTVINITVVFTAFLQEFHNIYRQFFPHGDPTKFANFVFNVFDANKVSCREGEIDHFRCGVSSIITVQAIQRSLFSYFFLFPTFPLFFLLFPFSYSFLLFPILFFFFLFFSSFSYFSLLFPTFPYFSYFFPLFPTFSFFFLFFSSFSYFFLLFLLFPTISYFSFFSLLFWPNPSFPS